VAWVARAGGPGGVRVLPRCPRQQAVAGQPVRGNLNTRMNTPFTAPEPDAAVYVISVAAELSGLPPQTLRGYERLGLIPPGRTVGGCRRYSHRDIELLRTIAELTAAGIGIEGVRRLL